MLIIFQHLVFQTGKRKTLKKFKFKIYYFSNGVSHKTAQRIFTPFRIYYHLTRWLYGNNYDPFGSNIKGVHPILSFLKRHDTTIIIIYYFIQMA